MIRRAYIRQGDDEEVPASGVMDALADTLPAPTGIKTDIELDSLLPDKGKGRGRGRGRGGRGRAVEVDGRGRGQYKSSSSSSCSEGSRSSSSSAHNAV